MICFCGNCANNWGLAENPMCLACDKNAAIPTNWALNEDMGRLLQQEPEQAQEAKADAGKLELDLVPTQIIRDIAEVRMYGVKKYGDPDNWKKVELRRYVNALYRHFQAFLDDPNSVDEESGIPHHKHMSCNMAFIAEMMKGENDG